MNTLNSVAPEIAQRQISELIKQISQRCAFLSFKWEEMQDKLKFLISFPQTCQLC
jgi:hypothetical protein